MSGAALAGATVSALLLWPSGAPPEPGSVAPPTVPVELASPSAPPPADCPDDTALKRRIADLERQVALLSRLAEAPAPLEFPAPAWEPERLEALLAEWGAACPAMADATVLTDCAEFPCLVSVFAPEEAGEPYCDATPPQLPILEFGSVSFDDVTFLTVDFAFRERGVDHPDDARIAARRDAWARQAAAERMEALREAAGEPPTE